VALSANFLARIVRPVYQFAAVRAPLSGILVVIAVYCVGGSYADRYLGGNAIGTPDHSGFYLLMYEGWGMMFPLLSIGFGVLAALREVFEKPLNATA
jgi:hypothetical protein